MASNPNTYRNQPDERGHFGDYGGRYVAETLMPLVLDLERQYRAAQADPEFQREFDDLLEHYVGRPSPLYFAERLTDALGGAQVWFKRDELNHTGAHKINNCIGQILLAIRMGKTRIIAETGAGQHGVATATVCARFGLPCVIYMGAEDVRRQSPNVFRMKLLGAEVVPVTSGRGTLKDAMNEGLRDWVANVHDTFYIIGTAAGPHPYPELVRDFQSVIGTEAKAQLQARTGRLPDLLVAAIGGGSNAIGLFHPFLDDPDVKMLGVEAAGEGLEKKHAASLAGGAPGILHGNKTYLLQDENGQIIVRAGGLRGTVQTDIPVITELSEEDISSYGAGSIEELIDALSTLAFDYPPRSTFFTQELGAFIRLCVDEKLDCTHDVGSYAGAMGLGQFMPSSYAAYAVDGNNDGKRDLWNQPADIIFSVANYLAENGWQRGAPIAQPATLARPDLIDELTPSTRHTQYRWAELEQMGVSAEDSPTQDTRVGLLAFVGPHEQPEYWIAEHNFFVITTYNTSPLYAMAVYQLGRMIHSFDVDTAS